MTPNRPVEKGGYCPNFANSDTSAVLKSFQGLFSRLT